MDLQEVFTKYKVADEDKQFVEGVIAEEKQRGIDESRRKGADVKKFMTQANRLKDFLSEKLNYDLDRDLDEQLAEQKSKGTSGTSGTSPDAIAEINKGWEKKFGDLKKQVTDAETKKTEAERKVKVTKLSQALSKALDDDNSRVLGADFIIKDLILSGKVSLSDDGETPVFVEGEETVEFAKGIDSLKKSHPELVISKQKSGGGSTASNSRPGAKRMALDQFEQLPAKERALFMSSGGTTF